MEKEKVLRMQKFASKLCTYFQAGASYAFMKVVPKAKEILPYLLLYYIFPTILSIVYTFFTQKYTIHHMHLDMQSLNDVDVCVEVPTLIAPGGTYIRNTRASVGFGNSDVHAFALVSHSLHELKHLQRIHIQDNMKIRHNEEFDASDITTFVRDRGKAWVVLEFDLGVNVILGNIYFRIKFKRSVDIFGDQVAKVFDIVDGDAIEDKEAIRASVCVRLRTPAFLRVSAPGFSMEAHGIMGGIDAKAHRLFTVSAEPFRLTEHNTVVVCAVCTTRKDIENIRRMVQSVERREEKSVMVFRSLDVSAFSVIGRKYMDAVIKGIVVKPESRDNSKMRRILKEPLIRIGICKVTPESVNGFVCVHRAFFPNSYIYELARNVRYENCSVIVDLEGVDIAKGHFHNRVEHSSHYVHCEFMGNFNNLALLICRVLHPEDEILSLGADGTSTIFSRLLSVWRMFVDFRKGIQVTSLGCMRPKPEVSHDDHQNNIIKVCSYVVNNEREFTCIATTIRTEDYRSSPYSVLEVSENQCIEIVSSLLRAKILINKGEVVFNIEESLGRIVSIGNPLEIVVLIEKFDDFGGVDCSRSTFDESMYHLLMFLLYGKSGSGCDAHACILERYVMDSCARHAFGMRKASLMVKEILQYDKYKVVFAFQGSGAEDAIVNIELHAPSVKLNMFPLKDGKMCKDASVQTEISPFALMLQIGRRSIAFLEAETVLPLSISVNFSTDLMAKQYTFMYRNEDTLLSCMINFCMNFFQISLSLDTLRTIKHKRREHEKIKNFTSKVLSATLDVDLNAKDMASMYARLYVKGKGCGETLFSINTEKIKISAVEHMSNNSNNGCNGIREKILSMDIAPLGINLRQKNNFNFYQRDIDISVWFKICILDCESYEFNIEYGDGGAENFKKHPRRFVLTQKDMLEIFSFLREFYGEPPMSKEEMENGSLLESIISIVYTYTLRYKKARNDTSTNFKENAGTASFLFQKLNTASNECDDRKVLVTDVRCTYGLLRFNRFVGSIMKRVNLEKYPQMFSLHTNLQIRDASDENRAFCYKIVLDDFPITYQDSYLRSPDETFKVQVVYPVKYNEFIIETSSPNNKLHFLNLLESAKLTSKIFRYNQRENMYYSIIKTRFKANRDLCIEIYFNEMLSFKMYTASCIHKDNITILPLFIVPINFRSKLSSILVKVHVNTTLLYSLKIRTKEDSTSSSFSERMIRWVNRGIFKVDGLIFSKNTDVVIDENEFVEKFCILKNHI